MSDDRGFRPHQVVGYEYVPNNLLVNPGFEIWQRGASFTPAAGANAFTADEWLLDLAGTDTGTVSRIASNYLGRYAAQLALTSGTNGSILYQGVENYDAYEGQWLTFSADIAATTTNTARIVLFDRVGGAAGTSDIVYSGYHSGGGSWERFTVTKQIRGSLDASGTDLPHLFAIGAGLRVDGSNTAQIDNASLVVGRYPEGVPYLPLNPAEDLVRCQRFYEYDEDFGGRIFWSGDTTNGSVYSSGAPFKSRKYAVPTVTLANATANGFPAASGSASVGLDGIQESRTANSGVSGGYFASNWTAEVT